jgi:large subunit ribosomal protein L25
MKTVSLSGSPREGVGKRDAAALRSEERVPCVLYGGDEQYHFSVEALALSRTIFSPDVFIYELDLGGKQVEAIVKEIQFHPVTDEVVHIDFLEIVDGKPVKLELPLRVTGNSIGVRNGGRLAINFRRIKVKGLPKKLPDAIELDITKLRIGHAIRVNEISLDGATVLHDPNAVVVSVKTAVGAVEDEEEDEAEEGEEGEGETAEGAEESTEAPAEE